MMILKRGAAERDCAHTAYLLHRTPEEGFALLPEPGAVLRQLHLLRVQRDAFHQWPQGDALRRKATQGFTCTEKSPISLALGQCNNL